MENKPILPPGYYTEADAEDVYEKTFDTIFRYFFTNYMNGTMMEFGTFKGYSARKIASKMKQYNVMNNLFMFDSFEGLPEITSDVDKNSYQVKLTNDWQKGTFGSANGFEVLLEHDISNLIGKDNTNVIKGYFDDTIAKMQLEKESAILINIDCDLYSSIVTVLNKLIESQVFQDGSIILFDDYNFNRANNNMGVRKAIQDTFGKQDKYELEQFFTYGWHGRAFFVHDNKVKTLTRKK